MILTKVLGVQDCQRELSAVPFKLRKKALLQALRAAGIVVRTRARARVPKLSPAHPAVLAGKRRSGTLLRAISVRRSKANARAGNVGIYVSVKPLSKSKRGSNNPNDPFYWRFVEFDTAKNRGGAKFLSGSADALPAALDAFNARIIPAINLLNANRAVRP